MDTKSTHIDISHLFLTNEIPTPQEEAAIRQDIEDLGGKISLLRTELAALEAQLQQRQHTLSSVRKLPLEVIGEIFGSLFVYPEGTTDIMDRDEREELLVLGLVCKGWWDALLGSHRLWRFLHVRRSEISLGIDKIATWFSRSGNLPKVLEVNIDEWSHNCGCQYDPEKACNLVDPSVVQLLTDGPIVYHLALICDTPKCFGNLMNRLGPPNAISNRPWDCVKSLDLTFASWEYREGLNHHNSVLDSLPPLTALHLYLPLDRTETRELSLNIPPAVLNVLTSITISSIWKGNHILTLLQHCACVENVMVDFDGRDPMFHLEDPFIQKVVKNRISLPHLQKLHLRGAPNVDLLQFIQAPKLVSLDINRDDFCSDWDMAFFNFFVPFATICKGTLQHLRIYRLACTTENLADVLVKLPALTHLTLERVTTTTRSSAWAILSETILSAPSSPPLPNLRNLELLQLPRDYNYENAANFLSAIAILPRRISWTVSYVKERPVHVDHLQGWFNDKEGVSVYLARLPEVDAAS
ncbi:hypothetical protein D9611_012661 [Ephemerocybe angulata]|uniref:F-box domain-containing protein n=1 Tax=Ephemerocybe angulata TaxID=980116 RepID=A0A8H5F0C3_9AGAR|nr:hypothetical protein D9611_012661 [Tulosesus angulatus]